MSENPTQEKPLPPIWRTPDGLWEVIEPILQEHDPPKSTGRPRVDQRAALDAIIFRMRSGCQCPMLTALWALTTAVLVVVVITLATLLITSAPASIPSSGSDGPNAGQAAPGGIEDYPNYRP